MTREQAGELLLKIVRAYPAVPFPKGTIAEWEEWLLALPYDVGRRAVLTVCASEDFPKIPALIRACGIGSEQAKALLIGAKDGGYEIVQADNAIGWTTTRKALAAPEDQHGEPVPMPAEAREKMLAAMGRLAAEKAVKTTAAEAAARVPR